MVIEAKKGHLVADLEISEGGLMKEEEVEVQLRGTPVPWEVVLETMDLVADGVEEWVEMLEVT